MDNLANLAQCEYLITGKEGAVLHASSAPSLCQESDYSFVRPNKPEEMTIYLYTKDGKRYVATWKESEPPEPKK